MKTQIEIEYRARFNEKKYNKLKKFLKSKLNIKIMTDKELKKFTERAEKNYKKN